MNLLKLAKQYSSSSDDLVPNPNTNEIPLISIETPDTLSPDDGDLAQTASEPQIQVDEADPTKEDNPALRHSITAPARLGTPSTDVEGASALETQGENMSPREKG